MSANIGRGCFLSLVLVLLIPCTSYSQKDSIRKEEPFKITHNPYLQALTDSSVSIVWTTNRQGNAWVELAPDDDSHFYQEERPKFWDAKHGLKNIGTVHKVDLKNLNPNTKYRYRVLSTEVLSHKKNVIFYGKTAATKIFKSRPLEFKTSGGEEELRFLVVNDIHGRNDVLNNFLDQTDLPKTDFIVFNGDMVNNLQSEDQMFEDFLETAIERFASEKEFYYARGNHETRGHFASDFEKYFPTPTGNLYYVLYRGDAAIIIMDTGEDKPESDLEYAGIIDMTEYRSRQAEWLEEELNSEKFKKAKYKIAIGHIPPTGRWYGEIEVFNKFVPVFNKAGVQMMLAAHQHRGGLKEEADDEINFPIITNSNMTGLLVELNSVEGRFSIIDQKSKVLKVLKIKPEN